MPNPQSTDAWLLLLEGVLDWPFLLFIIIIFSSLFFRQQLGGLLSRGDIAIDWGTGNIRLRDLSEKFDQEVDPVREELEALKQAVNALEHQVGSRSLGDESSASTASSPDETERRLAEALASPKFKWRSIPRLAQMAALSESAVRDVLGTNPEVVFSADKSGNQLAGLRGRVRPDGR
jgi:hypothetical protein